MIVFILNVTTNYSLSFRHQTIERSTTKANLTFSYLSRNRNNTGALQHNGILLENSKYKSRYTDNVIYC